VGKRKGIDHWLGQLTLPEPCNDAECLRLYPLVRGKHKPSIDRIVLGHIKFSFAIVTSVFTSGDSDSVMSVAFEALIDGVNRISTGALDHHTVPNITGYLAVTIKGKVTKFLNNKRILTKVPSRLFVLDHSPLEYKEILSKIIENSREEEVLELRLSGRKDPEIGRMIGLSKQRVTQIRQHIGQKLLALDLK
jgi:DNA-binding NarL/FixJ family response regulator